MTKRRGQKNGNSPATNGVPRKRKSRAPASLIIRLHSDIEANERHPLANLTPAIRDAQRQQLIASILARLASGPIQDSVATAKMTATPPAADEIESPSRSE
jgi:hypothetical protein